VKLGAASEQRFNTADGLAILAYHAEAITIHIRDRTWDNAEDSGYCNRAYVGSQVQQLSGVRFKALASAGDGLE
jgi:hypothetical protein